MFEGGPPEFLGRLREVCGNVHLWKYWYGLDLRTGRESWAVIPKEVVEYNTSKSNDFWTERTLRKIKR